MLHIPESLDAVRADLGGLERLLVAKRWERAAIVYAWTEPDHQHGGRDSAHRLSIRAFARLGIVGLKHPEEVREYRKAWESAHADGQASLDIKPGDDVDLPTLPWKDHFGEPTPEVQERVAVAVLKDPERAGRIMRNPVVRAAAERAAFTARKEAAEPSTARGVVVPHHQQYDRDVRHAMSLLDEALAAESRGEWTPAPVTVEFFDLWLQLAEFRLDKSAALTGYHNSELHRRLAEFLSNPLEV